MQLNTVRKNLYVRAYIFSLISVAITLLLPFQASAKSFNYKFDSIGVLHEASSPSTSTSPYWWLNSGGMFYLNGGTGSTIQNTLSTNNLWRVLYKQANPTDTDNGTHPQNLLRLVTKSNWQNFREQVYFKINKYNVSDSSNRNESNGVLLFGRYSDENNLYYVGVRVDGKAVIKKKKNGIYYTLATKQIFPGTYNRTTNPNLIPTDTWIGLRADIKNDVNNNVKIKLYLDQNTDQQWNPIMEYTENSQFALHTSASGGIRTDFMDIEFDEYYIAEI